MHRHLLPILLLGLLAGGIHGGDAPSAQALALIARRAQEARHAAARDLLVGSWERLGDRGPADAPARALLEAQAAMDAEVEPYDPGRLRELARAVQAAGAEHPLILTRMGIVPDLDGAAQLRLRAWHTDQALPPDRRMPAMFRISLARRLALEKGDQKAAALKELPAILIGCMRLPPGVDGRGARRHAVAYLKPVADHEALAELALTASQDPGADPWIAATVAGMAHVKLAWMSRGGGYANTVTEAGWKGFSEHLAQARERFTAASNMPGLGGLPEPALRMIPVAMGDNADQPRLWFDRAVRVDPWSDEPWSAFSWSQTPRWGGSVDALVRLLGEIPERTAPGSPGRRSFLAVLDNALLDARSPDQVWRHPAAWPAFDRITAGASTPSERTVRLALAWACGQHEAMLAAYRDGGGLETTGLDPRAVPKQVGAGLWAIVGDCEALARGWAAVPAVRPLAKGPPPGPPVWEPDALLAGWYERHGRKGTWDADARLLLGPMLAHDQAPAGAPDPSWQQAAQRILDGPCAEGLAISVAAAWRTGLDARAEITAHDRAWDSSAHLPPIVRLQVALRHPEAGGESRRERIAACLDALDPADAGLDPIRLLGAVAWLPASDQPARLWSRRQLMRLAGRCADPWLAAALHARAAHLAFLAAAIGPERTIDGRSEDRLALDAWLACRTALHLAPDRLQPVGWMIHACGSFQGRRSQARAWHGLLDQANPGSISAAMALVAGLPSNQERLELLREMDQAAPADATPVAAAEILAFCCHGRDKAWKKEWPRAERLLRGIIANPALYARHAWARHWLISAALACDRPDVAQAVHAELGGAFRPGWLIAMGAMDGVNQLKRLGAPPSAGSASQDF